VLGEGGTAGGRARSSTTTLNLYVHLWPGDEDRIRQAVDQAVALVGTEDSLRTEGDSR
jgi:hypothetical protein